MISIQKTIRTTGILVVSIFLMMSQFGVAYAGDGSFLSKFQGEWNSDDNAFGQSARSTMVWSPDLNDHFMRLEYKIVMGTGGKNSIFQGTAYYKPLGKTEYVAFWADNRGELHPIKATVDGNALVSIWGVEGKKLGRTRYELQDKDHLSVTDWIKKGDDWRQFNYNVFTRIPLNAD